MNHVLYKDRAIRLPEPSPNLHHRFHRRGIVHSVAPETVTAQAVAQVGAEAAERPIIREWRQTVVTRATVMIG